MGVQLIIDSSADMNKADCEAAGITLVPLRTVFGQTEYLDGVDITPHEFYEKLIESDELPRTSMASIFDFQSALAPILDAGDDAVIITISSKLSGTYQSAYIAAGAYPDRAFAVDSLNVSVGVRVLVDYALRLRGEGLSAAGIAAELTRAAAQVRTIALLDTLEYLKKGGRISKAVAFAGGVLGIKPVVAVHDGEVAFLGKARGSKQGHNLLTSSIDAAGGVDFTMPIQLGYTGLNDALLQKYIRDSAPHWEGRVESLPISAIGACIGTHVGPGAVAVAFFASDTDGR